MANPHDPRYRGTQPGGLPVPYHQPPQQPMYGPMPVMPVVVAPLRASGMATAALVCGILGLVFGWCLFGIPSLLAVILGHMGMAETKDGTVGGRGSAVAGLILGYLIVVPSALIAVWIFAALVAGSSS